MKTVPSPQIVVRKVIQEKASPILRRLHLTSSKATERRDGNSPGIYPPKEVKSAALARNIRELA